MNHQNGGKLLFLHLNVKSALSTPSVDWSRQIKDAPDVNFVN